MMRLDKITRAAVDALEDVKARDIVVFDVKKMTAFFDKVIVATGESNRQCRALASRVQDVARSRGEGVLRRGADRHAPDDEPRVSNVRDAESRRQPRGDSAAGRDDR